MEPVDQPGIPERVLFEAVTTRGRKTGFDLIGHCLDCQIPTSTPNKNRSTASEFRYCSLMG